MRKLIVVLGLFVCFTAIAENSAPATAAEGTSLERPWRAKLRGMIISVAGDEWANKLLGELPKPAASFALPEIPKIEKKNTDTGSYNKIKKDPTDYDKLPNDRKRQFDYNFVKELFQVTRKAEAKDEDLSNWLNVLDQGGSREGIYQGLVLDEVYATLENMEEKPSQKLVQFTLAFAKKFLNQTFKEETIKGLNLYSLKRILAEKGLDLMDHWETIDLDPMYKWYAIISADLAAENGSWLHSKVRQATSPEFHYEWAKKMPLQHVKSEFIVKLHTVMNGLQLLSK